MLTVNVVHCNSGCLLHSRNSMQVRVLAQVEERHGRNSEGINTALSCEVHRGLGLQSQLPAAAHSENRIMTHGTIYAGGGGGRG